MFVHYRTHGILIRKENRGESSQLLTFYTKDFGKLEIIGRAIRKISSKLRQAAEIFYLTEIEFIQGKRRKTLTDAIVIEKFDSIRKDLIKTKMAYRIAEVFDDLVSHQERDKKLWDLLLSILKKINDREFKTPEFRIEYSRFIWGLISELGYMPELYHCVSCYKKLRPHNLYFCPTEGGIICGQCSGEIKGIKAISANTVKILRQYLI